MTVAVNNGVRVKTLKLQCPTGFSVLSLLSTVIKLRFLSNGYATGATLQGSQWNWRTSRFLRESNKHCAATALSCRFDWRGNCLPRVSRQAALATMTWSPAAHTIGNADCQTVFATRIGWLTGPAGTGFGAFTIRLIFMKYSVSLGGSSPLRKPAYVHTSYLWI